MCIISCTTYTKCGHHKTQTEAVCPAGQTVQGTGQNLQGVCNNGMMHCAWNRFSDAPSLCVNCYRRHVDHVIARYKQMIAAIDGDIRTLVWKLRAVNDDDTRKRMQTERSEMEVRRGEMIDDRYEELERFRVAQKVWGDGGSYEGYRPFGTRPTTETA
ncbi:MAG: hypothetical protein Q9168_006463 [Polycauliona sp. 1 TL-2023]